MEQDWPVTFNWQQSLQTIQLRVVGFAYHREQFLDLQARSGEPNPEMFNMKFPDAETFEVLPLDAALAGAQLWAASQALHSACDMMLRVFDYTRGWQRQVSRDHATLLRQGQRSQTAMKKLRGSDAFQYLDGFVSLSHREQLLRVCARSSSQGNLPRQQLMIDAFNHEFDNVILSFSSKWVDDFLCRDCEGVIELCSQLGEAVASEIT